jgi:hypothetical protein
MTLVLNNPHGFSDQSDAFLASGTSSLGLKIAKISDNAAFAQTRLEVFKQVCKHGDVVTLPVSAIDGYTYSRNELIYCWAVQSTGSPKTNWATYGPPWTMWYGVWSIDQAKGTVSCSIGYRGNDDHRDRQAVFNDSILEVTIFAQRGLTTLTMSSIPPYVEHVAAEFVTDAALTQKIMQELNRNAKFAVVKAEAIYMGTFQNGAQLSRPVSPVDGYVYQWIETQFITSPFWTGDDDGAGNFQVPDISKGQLQDWSFTVDGKGLVTANVTYQKNGTTTFNKGRVQVVAFCQRRRTNIGLMGIVGAWCDASGNVIQPFEVGYGGSWTCPAGATKLQLGVNDDTMSNTGTNWTVNVVQTGSASASAATTVTKNAPPWNFTAGINSAYPFGLGGTVDPPVVVALTFVAGDVATITWTGGGPVSYNGVAQVTTPDGTNGIGINCTGTNPIGGSSGGGFPTRWTGLLRPAATPTPAFVEQDSSLYAPGSTLRASSLVQMNKNVNNGTHNVELFMVSAQHGTTIGTFNSLTDNYAYAYSEMTFIWDWINTGPDAFATDRLVLSSASINPTTGLVTINQYRFQSGGSNWGLEHNGTIKVWVLCKRNTAAPNATAPTVSSANGAADDSSGSITVNGV